MEKRTCSAEGCENPRRRYGFCAKHSQRYVKYGTPELPVRERPLCSGPQCDRTLDPIQNKTGLCRSHYKQQVLGKPLTALKVATKDLGRPATCTYPGCERPHKARGLCKSHNAQAKAGDELRPVKELPPSGPCEVAGCGRPRIANGMCAKHNSNHRQRWYHYGLTPEIGQAMYESQGRACAICGTAFDLSDLHIDHDHACCKRGSCGQCVRGLLCQPCNIALGYMRDDPARLLAGVEYLRSQVA